MKTLILSLLAALAFVADPAWAVNRYVRAGATGNGSGADWTNAYPALPSTLVRGDTYYVASGNYPAYTFDDPQSGSQVITIKKATVADHGTDVGWNAAYAAGQAIFNSIIRFDTGNYVFDGSVRNESDWFDGASYGFRVNHNNQNQNIVIAGGSRSSNIAIKYVYVDAIYGNLPNVTVRRYAIDTDTYGESITTGLVFHRMYVRGSNNVWFLRTTNGAILEYSASEGAQSNNANHGEIVNLYYSGNNAIIRYNHWKNAFVVGDGGTALVAITQADGLQFYGNVADNFFVGDGAVGYNGYATSNNRVYNNTFVRGIGYNSGMAWGSGTNNVVQNNLFIDCRSVWIDGSHDFNGFGDGNTRGEANAQINVPTSIFVNFSAGDLRLRSETARGAALSSPFNADMLGMSRGADGTFSRGAYEFASGVAAPAPAALTPPTNVVVR
jgi:hypothetical protein